MYVRMYSEAMRTDHFEGRVIAAWGLVANGSRSLDWVRDQFASGDEDRIEDAAGVLRWIGASEEWLPQLRALLDGLPDCQAADALAETIESIIAPSRQSRSHRELPSYWTAGCCRSLSRSGSSTLPSMKWRRSRESG